MAKPSAQTEKKSAIQGMTQNEAIKENKETVIIFFLMSYDQVNYVTSRKIGRIQGEGGYSKWLRDIIFKMVNKKFASVFHTIDFQINIFSLLYHQFITTSYYVTLTIHMA